MKQETRPLRISALTTVQVFQKCVYIFVIRIEEIKANMNSQPVEYGLKGEASFT